jgi:hypothetical protein
MLAMCTRRYWVFAMASGPHTEVRSCSRVTRWSANQPLDELPFDRRQQNLGAVVADDAPVHQLGEEVVGHDRRLVLNGLCTA